MIILLDYFYIHNIEAQTFSSSNGGNYLQVTKTAVLFTVKRGEVFTEMKHNEGTKNMQQLKKKEEWWYLEFSSD